MNMCDSSSLELHFKIGIIKELHKKGLISEAQMKKAVEVIMNQENKCKGANEE